VCPCPLCPRLSDVQPGADGAHRGHLSGRDLISELLCGTRLQRMIVTSVSGCPGHARHAWRDLDEADDRHEQLIGANQRDRRPPQHQSRHAPTVGDVGGECRRDSQT
jgi:hypothetical protein